MADSLLGTMHWSSQRQGPLRSHTLSSNLLSFHLCSMKSNWTELHVVVNKPKKRLQDSEPSEKDCWQLLGWGENKLGFIVSAVSCALSRMVSASA
jgi:hypothetical protein